MFAIDTTAANTVSTLPAPAAAGTPAYFLAGPPGTQVTGDFLNMLQGELLNVVEGAGLSPSKTSYDQLWKSIQVAASSGRYAVDSSGAANTIVIAPPLEPTAYAAGLWFLAKIANTNTGPCTLNVSGVGAASLTYQGGDVPPGGLAAGQIVMVAYDGAAFEVLSPLAPTAVSLTSPGFYQAAGGPLEQWGVATVNGTGGSRAILAVTFPKVFQTGPFYPPLVSCQENDAFSPTSNGNNFTAVSYSASATGFSIRVDSDQGAAFSSPVHVSWNVKGV